MAASRVAAEAAGGLLDVIGPAVAVPPAGSAGAGGIGVPARRGWGCSHGGQANPRWARARRRDACQTPAMADLTDAEAPCPGRRRRGVGRRPALPHGRGPLDRRQSCRVRGPAPAGRVAHGTRPAPSTPGRLTSLPRQRSNPTLPGRRSCGRRPGASSARCRRPRTASRRWSSPATRTSSRPATSHLWAGDPFVPRLGGGAIHARGACDMKAGVIASLAALAAVRTAGVRLVRPVALHGVVGEEDGGLGAWATLRRGHLGDVCVIPEPTAGAVVTANAGALTFRLEVTGHAAHAAMRDRGVSAVELFAAVHAGTAGVRGRTAAGRRPALRGGPLPRRPLDRACQAGDWAPVRCPTGWSPRDGTAFGWASRSRRRSGRSRPG